MISTQTLSARIQTVLAANASLATVSRVLDFDAVLSSDLRSAPMLWVVLDGEEASENALDNGVSQKVSVSFSVIYAAVDVGTLDTLRTLLRTALLAWTPGDDPTASPCEFRSGEIADLAGDIVWWRDTYATSYLSRAV